MSANRVLGRFAALLGLVTLRAQGGKTMAIKMDDILMLFCVSGFFAGVVVAVTTLPV
jgi:hypothetical protein